MLVRERGHRIVNVDALTYAGSLDAVEEIAGDANYRFEHCDIADIARVGELLREERIDGVVHLAAETHVDRSIASPTKFIETNILGTFRLLEAVLGYWRGLGTNERAGFRFHHVSTDEVFGDHHSDGEAAPSDVRYRPSSPYSASKAASDHLVTAWQRTYGLPVILSNSTNTYGPYQFPDKLIPLAIARATNEQPIPVYGTGENVRDWLYVDDHVLALEAALQRGCVGQSYHFSGDEARSNLQLVRLICTLLDERRPRPSGRSHSELIAFVEDRPGHDRRYAIDARTATDGLGWAPSEQLESGLAKTVDWYLANEPWWRPRIRHLPA
jgi:dTDP-glucose 4,6-dehydratase